MKQALVIIGAMLIFLFSIDMMGESFSHLGRGVAESILFATSNPFIGLFIGLLITAIIQSSSTSTSMIVALVASGSITIAEAVPMIMGANIGTTLTSTIVSLGFITKKTEFRRAIAAGTVHDFFNILTTLILFPLEYYYGFISSLSQYIANMLVDTNSNSSLNEYGFKLFHAFPITPYVVEKINNGFISLGLAFILLFGSIKILSKVIYKMIIGESQDKLRNFVFNRSLKSFAWGMGLTAAVQSSSVTTSLMVPFVATGRVSLKKVTPFIFGANVGTTITAFIAVLFKSNAVISIAITHLLFNLIGVIIFLPFPFMRRIPIRLAVIFGKQTMKHRITGFIYIILTFFLIPFTLIYFNKNASKVNELTYLVQEHEKSYERKVIRKTLANNRNMIMSSGVENDLGDIQQSSVLNIYRNKKLFFINNRFFLINKPGFCWDDENSKGKFQTCITQILPNWDTDFANDSVYVYTRTFYDKKESDSLYRYYISIPEQLLLKTEKVNNQGEVTLTEKLIRINKI
ncbi:Na/Pi symporter [Fulvivirga sediminis]|uniref:Na/Pi symporter n=1 Tax=Fulvivirga sediminis TaxID=2803949 RepID=UPI00293D84CE|nr:Na/Pi symporter [Fulvivirga sediminis]